jgi:hypothetical protein
VSAPQPTHEWSSNYPHGKPSLAWTAADYVAWKMDVPRELSGETTEADLMDDHDIELWMRDSVATIRVVGEHDPGRAAKLREGFIADLHYLLSHGKASEEMLDFALNEANFKWYDGRDGK